MCLSAEMSFAGSAVIAAVDVASLHEMRRRRAVAFASLPLLFAFHQFAEGFLWLGLQDRTANAVAEAAAVGFVLYAQAVLPTLAPLAVLLVEPHARPRQAIVPCWRSAWLAAESGRLNPRYDQLLAQGAPGAPYRNRLASSGPD